MLKYGSKRGSRKFSKSLCEFADRICEWYKTPFVALGIARLS